MGGRLVALVALLVVAAASACAAPRAKVGHRQELASEAGARMQLGDLAGAVEAYTRLIETRPGAGEAYFNRGNARAALGDDRAALADYDRAIALRPAFASAVFNRGVILARMGLFASARAEWDAAIASEPDEEMQRWMRRAAAYYGAIPTRLPEGGVLVIPGVLIAATAQPVVFAPGRPVPAQAPAAAVTPLVVADPAAAPRPAGHPASTVERLEASALVQRAVSREVDGDRAGAMADLRSAAATEPDPSRRARIERLLQALQAL